MKETRTINLNGLVYHIDNDAYQLFNGYLHDIEMRLPIEDRTDVMEDVEARIAELFQKALFAKNIQVINIELVNSVKAQIGNPSDFGPNSRPVMKENKSQNIGCGRIMGIALNIILILLALPVIFFGIVFLIAIIVALFGITITGTTTLAAAMPFFPMLADLLVSGGAFLIPLLMIALIAVILLPLVMLVYTIVTYMRTRRGPKARFWWITIVLWLASLIFWGASLVRLYKSYDQAPQILNSIIFEDMDWDEMGATTTPLQLAPYHSVHLTGAAKLQLSNASESTTTLTSNMMNSLVDAVDMKVEVRDSILYIDMPKYAPIDNAIAVFTIASPMLRKITISGAAKLETLENQMLTQPNFELELNGAAEADLWLNIGKLTIDSKGASKLDLEGTAMDVHISIAGAGKVEAEDLVAQKMHINCTGASKAEVNVVRELWAQAAGASVINYKGNPQIKECLAVGGSFIKKDR